MDVFNQEAPDASPSANDLVGEGKKFKDVDALVKGKIEADNFIEQLKAEMAGLRADLDKKISAEQQLEQLKNELKQRQDAGTQTKPQTGAPLSASDIEALVERTVTARERTRSAAQNVEDANNQAIRHFGTAEAAHKAVQTYAVEKKISLATLKGIASESPTAFMQMLGVTAAAPTGAVGSFVQPSAGVPDKEHVSAVNKPGTYEFAENVRRTDPRKYWTPTFQNKYVVEAKMAGTYKIPN